MAYSYAICLNVNERLRGDILAEASRLNCSEQTLMVEIIESYIAARRLPAVIARLARENAEGRARQINSQMGNHRNPNGRAGEGL